jgi:hypothetical protein
MSKLYVSQQVEIVLKGEVCFMDSHHQLHKVDYFLCTSYLSALLCQKFKKTDFLQLADKFYFIENTIYAIAMKVR